MVDRKDKRFFDFMCSCGEENMERCEKVYNDVLASFNEGKREVTDKDFLNEVVYSLNDMDNGMAEIDGIHSDMWSGIAIEYHHFGDNGEERKPQRFWIECDRVHHGLARAYQLVKEYDETWKK